MMQYVMQYHRYLPCSGEIWPVTKNTIPAVPFPSSSMRYFVHATLMATLHSGLYSRVLSCWICQVAIVPFPLEKYMKPYAYRTATLSVYSMSHCTHLFRSWNSVIDFATSSADEPMVSVDSSTGEMPMITRGEWSVSMVHNLRIASRIPFCDFSHVTAAWGNVLPQIVASAQ